ncbi:MAG: hypothetical protein K2X50_01635 [Gammaproteobacteria bacterium]|nr:hypothetical protein [Gammaproteobacteria bacterium]
MKSKIAKSNNLMNKTQESFTDYFNASRSAEFIFGAKTTTILRFKKPHIAQEFFDFVKERLPLLNTEFPKIDGLVVYITDEQYFYCKRQAMSESGNLTTDYINDCLLKTLRADEFDFSHQFILGIIPGENNSRRLHNLRPSQRKQFLIAPDGRIKPRETKQPMYAPKEKAGFSQTQSNTLLDPNALSRAFGFSIYHRNEKLYGIVTHTHDSLFNRLLTDDSGTVARIFDYDSTERAQSSLSWLKGRLYTTDQIEEFKRANKKARMLNPRTNEVLARIRFNPYRSVVSICSDTLEARLLAYDFAQELLEHYKDYAEKNNLTVNPHFKIPIIFYIRKNTFSGLFSKVYHDIKQYTDQMRRSDEEESVRIYSNLEERIEHYRNCDFEFLLGLPEITSEILLDTCMGAPLAYVMLNNGYTRMLMRLLKEPKLRNHVFDTLDSRDLFKKNDPIIANLILAEQFDLADKLITATNSEKNNIQIVRSEHVNLFDHLLYKGNPRQIQFMGLDEMLLVAAEQHKWVTIKLCLKEFTTTISKETLSKLFSKALFYKKACESKFMFQMGAEIDEMMTEFFKAAIEQKHWEYVVSFFSNPVILANKPLLGRALMGAIKDKQVETARTLFNAGAIPEKDENHTHFIDSVLIKVIFIKLFELVPAAIELETKYDDEALQIRFCVALQLANELQNSTIITSLDSFKDQVKDLNTKNIKIAICYLVLDALYDENIELAKTRLIKLCHQYQLLPTYNTNISDALNIVMEYYPDAATSLNLQDGGFIFYFFVGHYLSQKNSDKLIFLITSIDCKNKSSFIYPIKVHNAVYMQIIKYLSSENVDIIKDFVNKYIESELDPDLKSKKSKDWNFCLQSFFSEALRSEDNCEGKILLLLEIWFPYFYGEWANTYESLLIKGYLKAAERVVTYPKIKEVELNECVGVLIRYPRALQGLSKTVLINVNPEHIRELLYKHYAAVKNLIMALQKLESVNDYATLITQFFYISIERRHWKDIELFTSIPIILNNKTLLGVALNAAIAYKEIDTARFLMDKGAMPEKRSYYPHFIEGVLYQTLENRLYDLIPDAIVAESKYNDESVQIRYIVALQLSYQLGHSQTIRLLENLNNRISNPNPHVLKIAICYVFLKTLSFENTQLAEERLINLCHQYKLLSNDNNNIGDAIDLIIEHFNEVSGSIPHGKIIYNPNIVYLYIVKHCLDEKNINKLIFLLTSPKGQSSAYFYCLHYQIYTSLLSHLSQENVTTVKSFICEYINNDKYNQYEFDIVHRWQSDLRQYFGSIVSREDYNEDNILLLFDIGLVLSEDWHSKALASFLKKGFLKAASKILADPKLRGTNLNDCIDVLKYYPQYVRFLAPFLSNRIMPLHVKKLCFMKSTLREIQVTKEEIIALLKQSKNDPIHNNRHYWYFYFTLDFSTLTETLEIEKELARLLKPSIIKHMILIYIVDRFRCCIKPFHDNVLTDTSVWPNLTAVFKSNVSLIDCSMHTLIETIDPQQSEILVILNNYFININSIPSVVLNEYFIDINAVPSEEQIETAYTKVMELFELATQSNSAPTSPSSSDQFDFNAKFATYMKSLNIELAKHHQANCHTELVLPTSEENADSDIEELPVYYLR